MDGGMTLPMGGTGGRPLPLEVCGNGVIEPGEVCDDGNNIAGDGCSAACSSDESCGNGVLDPNEVCDDGNQLDFDLCNSTCTSNEACGNGVVDAFEVCDDGNRTSGDGCSAACDSFETCGNGVIDSGEACDDGNQFDGDGCDSTCTSDESCGNAVLDPGEECDDGNTFGGDGCSADCTEVLDGMLYVVRESDNVLRRLSPLTLEFEDVGPLGVAFEFGEIDWDASRHTLWMVDGRGAKSLYTVNLGTGAATLVGAHGVLDLFSVVYNPFTAKLYGTQYNGGGSPPSLWTLNPSTGAATDVGPTILPPNAYATNLDCTLIDAPRGRFVGIAAGGGALYQIAAATGELSLLHQGPFINNCGCVYNPLDDLYWAIDWSGSLYTYDPSQSYARTQLLQGLGAHDGMAFVPAGE
jgi:cysteine-rich repeat protein